MDVETAPSTPAAVVPSEALASSLRDTATAAYKAGDYATASATYASAVEALGTPPLSPALAVTLLTNRAAALMMLKRFSEASAACALALTLESGNSKALARKGKADLALGYVEASIASFSAAAAADPTNAALKSDRALAQGAWKRVCEMRGALSEGDHERVASLSALLLADSCPGCPHLRMSRAEALLQLGRLDDALALTEELMHLASAASGGSGECVKSGEVGSVPTIDVVALLVLRARVLNYQGHAAGATKLLSEALRNDPDCAPAQRLMRLIRKSESLKEQGNAAFKAGKWDEACTLYASALELDARNKLLNAKLHANRAAALIKGGKAGEAMEDCNACIALDDKYVKGYLRRAQAAVALGDVDSLNSAIRDYSSAKEILSPTSPSSSGCGGGRAAAPSTMSSENRDVLRDVESGLKSARAALKAAKKKDYYALLDVDKSADEDALKKAYKRQALKWHPDRHSCASEADQRKAEAMFKDITEANEVLSDPAKRRRYDMITADGGDYNEAMSGGGDDDGGCGGGGCGGMRGGGMRGGGMGGMNQADLFQMLFAAQMGGGGMGMPGMGGPSRGGFQPRQHR